MTVRETCIPTRHSTITISRVVVFTLRNMVYPALMSKVLAVGGPKGGVGKTTVALNIATNAARLLKLKVLLVDADPNRSALDAAMAAGDAMPFDVAEGLDHERLVQLHRSSGYELVVADLPGAREAGALKALLTGGGRGKPSVDGLILPSRPEVMDLRPTRRVIREEIAPLNLPYLVALVRVHSSRVRQGEERADELRGMGLQVAHAMTRNLVAHDDALELQRPLVDMGGGQRSVVRAADREYRQLAHEALTLIGIDATPLLTDPSKED